MDWSMPLRRWPLLAALVFQAGLIPLALGLALLLGLSPWAELRPVVPGVIGGIAATLPLLLVWILCARQAWFRGIEELVRPLIERLFRDAGPPAIVAVAALAGLGEELLFRGVLQAAWVDAFGHPAGIALASLAFGLAHALTRVYFAMATIMGLYLGLLYAFTDNLLLVTVVHGLYDAVAIAWLLRTAPR